MEAILLNEIAKALGAEPVFGERYITDISTDTRQIKSGSLFLALRGERFDGNDFVAKAAELGAVAAVCERPAKGIDCIVVKDGNQALLDIAALYRSRFDIPICAVTGSVGKTTVKEMTALVFSERYKTLKTAGNLNNTVGMPKTLLCLDSSYGAAVIEMGMNHRGEIESMSRSCRPTMAIINNIGVSHIENLGSREGILKAKLEVLAGMSEGAPLIVNGDNDMLRPLKESLERPVYTYGMDKGCDFYADNIRSDGEYTEFDAIYGEESLHIKLPCIGAHNVQNALSAVAAGTLVGVGKGDIAAGLLRYSPVGLRQTVKKTDGITLIIDCYNASPDSMRAALSVLTETAGRCGGRAVAVLADMLELGEGSPLFHKQIGEAAAKAGVDVLACYGRHAKYIAAGADEAGLHAGCTDDMDMLVKYLKDKLSAGDVVLFKGSRGMRLEEAIKRLFGEEILK